MAEYKDEYWDIINRELERSREEALARIPLSPDYLGLREDGVGMPAIPLSVPVSGSSPNVSYATPQKKSEFSEHWDGN